jgi:hypothetical protein
MSWRAKRPVAEAAPRFGEDRDVLAGCEVVFPFTAETLRTRIDAVLAPV